MKQSDQASCLENLGRVGVGEDKLRDNNYDNCSQHHKQ